MLERINLKYLGLQLLHWGVVIILFGIAATGVAFAITDTSLVYTVQMRYTLEMDDNLIPESINDIIQYRKALISDICGYIESVYFLENLSDDIQNTITEGRASIQADSEDYGFLLSVNGTSKEESVTLFSAVDKAVSDISNSQLRIQHLQKKEAMIQYPVDSIWENAIKGGAMGVFAAVIILSLLCLANMSIKDDSELCIVAGVPVFDSICDLRKKNTQKIEKLFEALAVKGVAALPSGEDRILIAAEKYGDAELVKSSLSASISSGQAKRTISVQAAAFSEWTDIVRDYPGIPVILCARQYVTRYSEIERAVRNFRQAGLTLLGAVMLQENLPWRPW